MSITGPSSATPLALEKARVTIFDPFDPKRTAGKSAAAFVDPDWTAPPRAIGWQREALQFYASVLHEPLSGVMYGPVQVLRRQPRELELYESHLDPSLLAPDFPYGTGFDSYRINPRMFLAWAREKLAKRGVQFVPQEVRSFDHLRQESGARVVVNAAGVGARKLTGDLTLVPVRGHCARIHLPKAPQIVRLAALLQTWYVASGPDECRIGGTAEEDCWDLEPDRRAVDAMYRRVQSIMPFAFDPGANEIEVTCGLRPRRKDGVRLEHEQLASGVDVVHCYGQGSEGAFTCGPGWAVDARNQVIKLL